MRVIVGSNNKAKLAAVRSVFTNEIINKDIPSLVSAQPFSDEETLHGAINRAQQSVVGEVNSIGIGLEGGVLYLEEKLYLCNWGALVCDKGNLYIASGARIPLPRTIAKGLESNKELGVLIDQYVNKKDVRSNEGTIGIFTNGLVSRQELFQHVLLLLKGQWEYAENNE